MGLKSSNLYLGTPAEKDRKSYNWNAEMLKLVDNLDLGSSAEKRVGSSPTFRTKKN